MSDVNTWPACYFAIYPPLFLFSSYYCFPGEIIELCHWLSASRHLPWRGLSWGLAGYCSQHARFTRAQTVQGGSREHSCVYMWRMQGKEGTWAGQWMEATGWQTCGVQCEDKTRDLGTEETWFPACLGSGALVHIINSFLLLSDDGNFISQG